MVLKIDGVKSEDELKKAQAVAQAQGASVPNYAEWSQIMKELSEAGVGSTGSYEGDKTKMKEIQIAVEQYVKDMQAEQVQQQKKQETQKVKETSETDKEQSLKATVANATSSEIMSNYMKYYHLLL